MVGNNKKSIQFIFSSIFVLNVCLLVSGCKSGSNDFGEILNNNTNNDEVVVEDVRIISYSPETNPVRVTSTTNTTFAVAVNGTSGEVTYKWKLNGSLLVEGSNPFLDVNGSSFNSGTNTLEVIASNLISEASKIFNLEKNRAPTIATATPAAAGNTVTCGVGSIIFNVTSTDADNDGMSYTWLLNGAPPTSSFVVLDGAGASQNTFTPTCSLSGSNTVSVVVNDGYETTTTSWSVMVINPLVAQIIGQTPAGSPIVIQEGSSQVFTVSASGQAPFSYSWGINANPPVTSGAVPSYNASASSFPVPDGTTDLGINTFTVTVEDNNASTDSYVWNIKINSPPIISNPNPVSSYLKMSYLTTRGFSVTANDNNNDALSYTWKFNGGSAPAGVFIGSGSSITFSPTLAELGTHTISVTVGDGSVITPPTQSWTVNVNMFSDACNSLTTGKVCTILGAAGLGGGIDPIAEPQVVKMRPYDIVNDGNDNLFIADGAQDVVWFYNRSGSSINVIGTTVPAGQIKVIAGTGAYGTNSPGVIPTQYRLANPYGIAWDSDRKDLYVSAYDARRIVRFTDSGSSEHRLCNGGANNDAANHPHGGPAINHACDRPTGLAYDSARKRLYVANSDDDNIKYFDISNPDPNNWTGFMYICDKNASGACQAGNTNGALGDDSVARVNNPWALSLDSNGLLSFTELGGCYVGVANDTGNNYSFYGGAVLLNSGNAMRVGGTGTCNTLVDTTEQTWSAMQIRDPQGIVAYHNGTSYYGWFVSNEEHDAISFFNTSGAPITIGNRTIAINKSRFIWGNRVDGFNGDIKPAISSLLWYPLGLVMNVAQTNLYVADRDNYRIRSLDVSVNNGNINTIISGKEKADYSGGSNTAAPNVLMSGPTEITYDSNTHSMIYADYNNCRIRSFGLEKGAANTLVGSGCGNSDVEQEDPSDVLLRGPRGVLVFNNGVIYSENTQGVTANANSQIRVYNRNSTTTNFFGVNVPANKVSTIAGNFALGVQWWDPTNENQPATSVALNRPNSLTTDGTNLYFTDEQLNCVLKITPAGLISTYAGVCRTAILNTLGYVDASPYNSNSVRFRLPNQIAIDPAYSADGNLFVADQTDQGTSRIRYINTRVGSVQIADQVVPGNSVATVFATDGYGQGVAAFGNWVCYTSGRQSNGHQGSHHIWCYDRSDLFATTSFRVGPTGTSNKGAIQLANEDEGQPAGSVKFFTPYKLSFDNVGNLYVSEWDGHVIRRIEKWW
ncbi:MAG: hypothetical protein H6625_00090 [Bdellovibrionaceae bacterium]|nr:hypothetical protein [Pseudobdellovibrionaceae bacterium]